MRGYPTIKYFTDETGEKGTDYQGGRDFASLKKFVDDSLEVKCVVSDPKDCTEKEAAYITKMKAKGADDVRLQIGKDENTDTEHRHFHLGGVHVYTLPYPHCTDACVSVFPIYDKHVYVSLSPLFAHRSPSRSRGSRR